MINFFRKKRKTLADDNKALKYTRYAIGEIVLVVIGILIALQINTWNEHRKMQIQEQEILKGLEIEFKIKKTLPLNKYIQIFDFTSFLEISSGFLLSLGMDFNDRELTNLFTRLNKNTGEIEYCYSVNYKPLIRLDSVSVSISDTSQRSFPVNISLTYQIQQPVRIIATHMPGKIEGINVDFIRFGEEPISENSVRAIYNKNTTDSTGDIKRLTMRNLLIHKLDDFEFLNIPSMDKVSLGINFRKEDFIISPDFEFDFFDTSGKLHSDIKPSLIDSDENKVVFEFTKDEYELCYNATLIKPIILQFIKLQ